MVSSLYYLGGSDSTQRKKKPLVGREADGTAWGSTTDNELTCHELTAMNSTENSSTELKFEDGTSFCAIFWLC